MRLECQRFIWQIETAAGRIKKKTNVGTAVITGKKKRN